MSEQFTHRRSAVDGIIVNTVYKLESNKLWVDGMIACEFTKPINAVIFTLETGETVALKENNSQEMGFKIY